MVAKSKKVLSAQDRSRLAILGIVTALGLWLLSGCFSKGGDEEGRAEVERSLMTVKVERQAAEIVTRQIRVHGKTAGARVVDLKVETSGPVVGTGVARGSRVAKGDVILEIDIRDRREHLEAAEASLEQRKVEYAAAKRLSEKGLEPESRLAGALAALSEAERQLRAIRIDLANTLLRAPFEGVLADRFVEVGDYAMNGDLVARVIELDPLVVTGAVTERDVAFIEAGGVGHASLATGQTLEGRVRYLSPAADTATRTFTVELELPNPGAKIPAGVSADVTFPAEKLRAHRVSPALLTISGEGVYGVMAVDATDRARFYPVDIQLSSSEAIFVTGLPDPARIITTGGGFVKDGERVSVVEVPAKNPAQEDQEGSATEAGRGLAEDGAGTGI